MDAPHTSSGVADHQVLTYRDEDGHGQQARDYARNAGRPPSEVPVRITMYFGNRESAGPFVLGGADHATVVEDDDVVELNSYAPSVPREIAVLENVLAAAAPLP